MTAHEALAEEDPRRVGRYRLLARLGAGGMGQVFLARSPGGRLVAIKVVRPELADDPQFRQRFAREVAAARRVNSFYTAGVVDADPEGSPPWLATAYVAGVSLGEAVAAHGPWVESSVRALGAGLVEALETIHAAGVVHRDLKPSNVLLAPDGPRVIDFGISLAVEDTALTQTGAVVGTPGFMSPEQLTGAPVGPASDVFALGAVLGYTGTGVGPFGTGSAHAVNFRAVYEPPNLAGLPPELAELVGRCLAKEPERRPTVAELLDRLAEREDAQDGAPGPVAPGPTAADWLPPPVATAVRQRTESALPPSPPLSSPSREPAQTASAGPAEPTGPSDSVASPEDAPPARTGTPPPGPAAPGPRSAGGQADWTTVDSPVVGTPPPHPSLRPAPPGPLGLSRRGLLVGAGGVAAATAGVLARALSRAGDTGGGNAARGDAGRTPQAGGDAPATTARPGEVRIAFQGPLSGVLEYAGVDMLDAVRLAVADSEASGDHPDVRIGVLDVNDNGGRRARGAAERAIADEQVVAVVGPAFSSDAVSAAPLYAQAGLAFVSPSATDLELVGGENDTFLRAVPNDRQVGEAMGRFLKRQGAGRVVLVDDDTAYGKALARTVGDILTDASVEVGRDSVTEDVPDGEAHAAKIVAYGAEAVAYCGYFPAAGPLADGLAGEGWDGLGVGGPEIMGSKFVEQGEAGSAGWYVVCPCYSAARTATGREFARRYQLRTGREPRPQGAPRTYDVTRMVIEAVVELGAEANRKTVFERLARSRYQGLTGTISFDANGEYTGSGPELYRVVKGQFEPLGPVDDYHP